MNISKLKKGESYDVKSVKDIADMTSEQFDYFIIDLVNWYHFIQKTRILNNLLGGAIVHDDTKISWVYDGAEQCELSIDLLSEDGVRIDGSKTIIDFKED